MSTAGITEYRATTVERERERDLMGLVPQGSSVLDIGARDGHYSRLLATRFSEVVALDLIEPTFQIPGVRNVAGDVTNLDQFPDRSIDVIFCAEVLEHIPALEQACSEIARVAKHAVLVGVPYKQDTRCDRTTCRSCGKVNPPWGHVNTFDEAKLRRLFPGWNVSFTYVGQTRAQTNAVSAALMNLAGNPWGIYSQEEGCIYCGAKLVGPTQRPLWRRLCSRTATYLNRAQRPFVRPRPNWIHALFTR